jgi:hypothetical protein
MHGKYAGHQNGKDQKNAMERHIQELLSRGPAHPDSFWHGRVKTGLAGTVRVSEQKLPIIETRFNPDFFVLVLRLKAPFSILKDTAEHNRKDSS